MRYTVILPARIAAFVSIICAVLLAPAAKGQTTLFYDGFEGYTQLTNKWTLVDLFDEEAEPVDGWGIVNAGFGGESTRMGSNKVYSAGLKWLNTTTNPRYPDYSTSTSMERVIDFTDYSSATLSFWYKCRIPDVEIWLDYMEVYIDDNQVFSTDFLDGPVTAWTQVVIPLEDVAGGVHTLRFVFNSDDSNEPPEDWDPPITHNSYEGVYVDDVLVTGTKYDKPDFNFDGSADIVWQNPNGIVATWYFQGTTFLEPQLLRGGTPAGKGWNAVGTADLDTNGTADIIFQYSWNGQVAAWYMNGSNWMRTALLRSAGSAWRLAVIGDYDNDGNRDFIWQNKNDGKLALWRMKGTNQTSASLIRNGIAPANKTPLVGLGDFNSDGQKDLLFRQADGTLNIWHMRGLDLAPTGGTFTRAVIPIGAGTSGVVINKDWRYSGIHDFDGDGHPDLLMQHTDGRVAVWFLYGRVIQSSEILRNGTKIIGWFAVGPK